MTAPTPINANATLAGQVYGVYERNAVRFDRERARILFEAKWLARLAAIAGEQGRILDLGCGAGEPIARYFIERGFPLTGADFSPAMLDLARTHWPDGDWRCVDMRTLDLGERFDGVVAWDSFFHLTPDEQRQSLPRIAGHVAEGGGLLVTVGPSAGEVTGRVGDEAVYHASLAPHEYRALLDECGMIVEAFVAEDPDCDFHSVLLARRPEDGGSA